MTPIERAARALCSFDGHPENTRFEGRPMWESYRDQAAAVVSALGEWMPWSGGPPPVTGTVQVAIYFQDGRHLTRWASDIPIGWWEHRESNPRDHIARYRFVI